MAEEGQVIGVHTAEEWKEQIQKGNESKKLMDLVCGGAPCLNSRDSWLFEIVVDFTASWCGPCRFIAPILAEIAKNTPEVIFLKVDVDEVKSVAEEWNVEAMPTFIFLKEGKEVDKIVGANKEKLHLTIAKHVSAAAASS